MADNGKRDQGIHWVSDPNGHKPTARDQRLLGKRRQAAIWSHCITDLSQQVWGDQPISSSADNSQLPARGEQGYGRLQKVQPIITAMKQRCLSLYRAHAQNSIDEAMIPFKGVCISLKRFLDVWGEIFRRKWKGQQSKHLNISVSMWGRSYKQYSFLLINNFLCFSATYAYYM